MAIYDLQNRANVKNDGGGNERPSPAEACGDGEDEEAAEESSALQHADGVGIDVCRVLGGVAEVRLEAGEGEDAADDARVIAEEEGPHAADADEIDGASVA